MNFNNKTHIKRRYTRTPITITNTKKTEKKIVFRSFGYGVWFLAIAFLIFIFAIYQKYIAGLPDVKTLENLDIAQASTIYDKDWQELYKVYKEKRTYIPYEEISENMVHAIVAWEDQSFFTNAWVDFYRMTWAVVYYILWKTDRVKGTSTISQQLIRNTIITNEDSIERKIKEIYLSYKMTKELSKEKILELYLNKIFYWHNAYGIEQAAKTFFWTWAKNLWVLEASILASLPKWPSYYSPYNHAGRLLWYPYIYSSENEEEITKVITSEDVEMYSNEVVQIKEIINNFKIEKIWESSIRLCWLDKSQFKKSVTIDGNGCTITEYQKLYTLLNDIKIQGENVNIEYQSWRKDFILWRMLEDGYIDVETYKKSIIWWIWYTFNNYIEKIKYPYFVMYVKEYIEKKYGTDMLENAWLQIYTTLDSKLQDKAEELVEKYWKTNAERFDAKNSALVSIDNTTGNIISMVGGRDYFDSENKWNVNMATSPVQPGSSFKPFVYALWIDTQEIGSRTPIYDVKTAFPWYEWFPKNFDGTFMWKMDISTALNNSRNIPALKMFYLAGWEKKLVSMLESFWVTSMRHDGMYGAPMALWTAEISPLELAGAYSIFANLGYKKEISPILKIVDSKWIIVEDRSEKNSDWEKIFDENSSYIINSILSDTSTRPEWWNSFISLPWRPVAAKTGTSTKNFVKNWVKTVYPRNLLTIWYTPQITTVVWAGNADWKEVNMKGDWLNAAGPIWRDFMKFAHTDLKVENWKKPAWVKEIQISSISWFPAETGAENRFLVYSLFKNIPKKKDSSFEVVKVDSLCNGKVTEDTPVAAIKEVYLINLQSLSPANPAWETGIKEWIEWGWIKEIIGEENKDIVYTVSDEVCERDPFTEWDITFKANLSDGATLINGGNYIELAYRAKNPIIRVDVLIWETQVDSIKLNNKTEGTYKWTFSIPKWYYENYKITFRAIDSNYYYVDDVYNVNIVQNDSDAPEITLINPETEEKTIKSWESFLLKASIYDASPIKSINIYLDGTPLRIGETNRDVNYLINGEGNLTIWEHSIKIEAVDNTFKTSSKTIKLTVTE